MEQNAQLHVLLVSAPGMFVWRGFNGEQVLEAEIRESMGWKKGPKQSRLQTTIPGNINGAAWMRGRNCVFVIS